MKISIIVFTLNEIDGIKVILPRIKREWYNDLIIVDGGSEDGTIEYAKKNGYNIFVQKEKGPGAALVEALEKITGDIIIPFSPDGNFIPEKIPELLKKFEEGYDIVTVSRYCQNAKSYDDDFVTRFGNWMFTGLINLLFRINVSDSLYGYLVFNKKLISDLKIGKSSSWGPQLLIRARKRNLKLGEIPGDEPPRIGGNRKMNPLTNGLVLFKMILKEFFNRMV